ncbi:MAG: YihY/virulence factor BrkB family protein [Elusimicrobia bacterium]|nr:YihY/virulence factor BrkB family protein [Candidatus Liberimonas magnetica]
MTGSITEKARYTWAILFLSAKKFSNIDGAQRAGAFAFYAFVSLLPLIILLVIVVSAFITHAKAGVEVVNYIDNYITLSPEMKSQIARTLAGVIKARSQAGVIAFLVLIWGAMQFVMALVRATNRAWSTESYNWWRLPIKSFALFTILAFVALIGMALPFFLKLIKTFLVPLGYSFTWIYVIGSFFIPIVIIFIGLSLFYKLAPRRKTSFREVWAGAVFATFLLRTGETLFLVYLKKFVAFNIVYGTFGGIMTLLLSIYIAGYIFIFGACVCASQAEVLGAGQ